MTFGEVTHYVPHSHAWPEPVRDIASLLSSLHSADLPGSESQECPTLNPSESPDTPAAPAPAPVPVPYTAIDFQNLIHSTAAELKSLAELPHYGGARSTVPLWSQLLHAVSSTLSPELLILEDTSFIMPRVQDVAKQPSDLIDGQATLIVAHVICPTTTTHSDQAGASPGREEEDNELIYSANSSHKVHSDGSSAISGSGEGDDVLMYSADSDSHIGSVGSLDGLDLPLQAHMLQGRGKWHYAALPVLLVADARNIVPLLCSTLYQRRVWGIREPVVGLCCSNTGTIATAIFGWLDSDQSEQGCMPVAHIALAAGNHLDPLMGVFDFTDSCSAISLAQFILRLRSHFQDIKGFASMEAVNSCTPFHWRSDLPDFETQMGGQLEDRVVSWTHQVHVQTGSSDASSSSSSSSGPRTPSPLSDPVIFLTPEEMSARDLDIIHEEALGGTKTTASRSTHAAMKKSGSPSQPHSLKNTSGSQKSSSHSHKPALGTKHKRYSNSSFAAASDVGLVGHPNMSNWLLERGAFTVARIQIASDNPLADDSGINEMIELYDQMTGFTWSDAVKPILSVSTIDTSVVGIRDKLFEGYAGGNHVSTIEMPKEDVGFISARLSALLHAVKGACGCQSIANLHGVNEAERRHEWDALLLKFFQPVSGQRDVLLERQLNFPSNLAVGDAAFAQQSKSFTDDYEVFCSAQHISLLLQRRSSPLTNGIDYMVKQASAAVGQSTQFCEDIRSRISTSNFLGEILDHSCREPDKGKCDAVLVIPCAGAATMMLECIDGDKAVQDQFLKSFILVHGKPDKQDATPPIKQRYPHSPMPDPMRLQPPPPSQVSARQMKTERKALLQNVYLVHPDRTAAAIRPSEENFPPEAGVQDLLLPVLLGEYKKQDESTIAKAMNQMRTYVVSALRFLDALGIPEQPVFGLVVNGSLGAVTMAWQKNEKIYIMERNVRHYDITNPLDAFQFVSVLLRLARYGLELRTRFDEQKDVFYESLRESTYTRWSKLAQIQGEDAQGGGQEAASPV